MDIYIETLTGTIFELHVSPFETICSVKEKLQRLESIPIPSQHLIYRGYELDDEVFLQDCGITHGSTVRLVLSMRGGPINTTRRTVCAGGGGGARNRGSAAETDEQAAAIREMAEYFEENPDELFDRLGAGGGSRPKTNGGSRAGGGASARQVTLLVFRDGDQLNFFRVYDRGDGTLSPLSDISSCAAAENNDDDDDDEEEEDENEEGYEDEEDGNPIQGTNDDDSEVLSVEKSLENEAMLRRVTSLRHKLDQRRFRTASHARAPTTSPPKNNNKVAKSKSRTSRLKIDSNVEVSTTTLASELSALSSALLPPLPPPLPLSRRKPKQESIIRGSVHRVDSQASLVSHPRTELESRSQERLGFRRNGINSRQGAGLTTQRGVGIHLPPIAGGGVTTATKNCLPSSRLRCSVCRKKTTLVTSFSCRCGRNFCPVHRYAEMHACTFDYKTEGRQLLKQANPVVQAPKLPKI